MNNLKEKYQKEIMPALLEKYKNPFASPAIKKIVLNMGIGKIKGNQKMIDEATTDMIKISGQKPLQVKAKKSISSFSLRKGDIVGLKVTLRGERMYSFLSKFIGIVLPRVRDFRGLSEDSFDNKGGYSLGFRDLSVFPEIEYTKSNLGGIEITFTTTAKNTEETKDLLVRFGIPFRKK